MKSYTDIEQSKKLVEILPLESADMKWFIPADNEGEFIEEVSLINNKSEYTLFDKVTDWNDTPYIPCWSLATLLDVLPKEINALGTIYSINIHMKNEKWFIDYKCNNEEFVGVYSNIFLDACYEILLKLNKLKML